MRDQQNVWVCYEIPPHGENNPRLCRSLEINFHRWVLFGVHIKLKFFIDTKHVNIQKKILNNQRNQAFLMSSGDFLATFILNWRNNQ